MHLSAFPLSMRLTRLVRGTHRDDKRGSWPLDYVTSELLVRRMYPLNVFISDYIERQHQFGAL